MEILAILKGWSKRQYSFWDIFILRRKIKLRDSEESRK